MVEFTGDDLRGSTFDQVDLGGSRFRNVQMVGTKITGMLIDVEIGAMIQNLRVNGVDVVPLVEAELDRRDPDRAIVMRPQTPDDVRKAWEILERGWEGTIRRARGLDPQLLHERVDGEWSFIETLRHLIFVTDAWLVRTVLGERHPWHRFDLPQEEAPEIPGLSSDPDLRPSLDEVLSIRGDRTATVRRVIADLTDDQLAEMTEPVTEPGYPQSGSYPVRDCIGAVLSEEWEHRLYAERDLEVLVARS